MRAFFAVLGVTIWAMFLTAHSAPARHAVNTADLAYPEYTRVAPALSTCSKEVVVAVLDTGIDYTHPDLAGRMWESKDLLLDGKDDDQNGYKDDVVGWDFTHNFRLPYDTHGHGTHVAGIIVRVVTGKLYPVQSLGCLPNVKIMAIRYYDNGGLGYNNLINTVAGFEYAIANGAHIINYSGGGPDSSQSEKEIVKKALDRGILVVAAAGNDGLNNDRRPYYPASYEYPNLISVGSHNKQGWMLPSSNFGVSVHVAAEGLMVLSSLPGGKNGTMSGTSQATPIVTGLAASLMSAYPNADYVKVKAAILDSAVPYHVPNVLGRGFVNAEGAVQKMSQP